MEKDVLAVKFCGWEVRVNGILLVSSFCDVFSTVSRSLSTTLERSLNVKGLGHLGWGIRYFRQKSS